MSVANPWMVGSPSLDASVERVSSLAFSCVGFFVRSRSRRESGLMSRRGVGGRANEVVADREQGKLQAARDADLAVDLRQVVFHGFAADCQPPGDLAVRVPARDRRGDLE